MLVEKTPLLSVRQISAHMGVRDWVVARELKLERLKGVKATGAGRVGQGGQWQIEHEDFLDWLGVPEVDRTREPDGTLPEDQVLPTLYAFEDIAVVQGLTVEDLTQRVEVERRPHLRIGRSRWFTQSQLEALPAYQPQETPASG